MCLSNRGYNALSALMVLYPFLVKFESPLFDNVDWVDIKIDPETAFSASILIFFFEYAKQELNTPEIDDFMDSLASECVIEIFKENHPATETNRVTPFVTNHNILKLIKIEVESLPGVFHWALSNSRAFVMDLDPSVTYMCIISRRGTLSLIVFLCYIIFFRQSNTTTETRNTSTKQRTF